MKQLLMTLGQAAAWIITLPHWLLYLLLRLLTNSTHACQAIMQRAARWPGDGGNLMRAALYRRILKHVGKNVIVSFGSMVTKNTSVLEDYVYVGANCILGSVHVGKDTLLADHVCIPSGSKQHGISRLDIPVWQQKGEFTTIVVGCDCWIGSNSVILADVGNHCVVGAGSVVTKPVPDYAIVVGNPAKQIGDRRTIAEEVAKQSSPPADPQSPVPY